MIRTSITRGSIPEPTPVSKTVDAPIYNHLLQVSQLRGAGFVVLVDPDKLPEERLPLLGTLCAEADVDFLFVGGSLVYAPELDRYVRLLKAVSPVPVIGFPGSLNQVAAALDAILYLSVISGRNPECLFGQHVYAAPLIKRMGIEPIATGYMLVESGHITTAQYMSHSLPLPRNKPDVAAATGLAAEMMGMRLLFTDAGSGADDSVPDEMVTAITSTCTIPLVVGGGLHSPRQIASKVEAGASFVVVGNAIEERPDRGYIAELAAAAHRRAGIQAASSI